MIINTSTHYAILVPKPKYDNLSVYISEGSATKRKKVLK